MGDNNEIINPAFDPARYANLDEQREGYAPIESRGWDILTQNLRSEAAPEHQPQTVDAASARVVQRANVDGYANVA